MNHLILPEIGANLHLKMLKPTVQPNPPFFEPAGSVKFERDVVILSEKTQPTLSRSGNLKKDYPFLKRFNGFAGARQAIKRSAIPSKDCLAC